MPVVFPHAASRCLTSQLKQTEMFSYAASLGQLLLDSFWWNPKTVFLVALLLLYPLIWLGRSIVAYRVKEQTFQKIPDTPRFGVAGYLLGSIDVIYYCMSHLSPSKATFQEVASVCATQVEQGFQRTKILFQRVVYFYRAKAVEALLTSSVNLAKSDDYLLFERWFGNGLLISTGDHWRRHRKVLTPAFHFRILDSFVSVMNQCAGEMMDRIEDYPKEGVDVRSYIASCTLDIICETAMGVRIGTRTGSEQYVKPLSRVLELITERLMNPLIHSEIIYRFTATKREFMKNLNVVQSFVRSVIQERSEEMRLAIGDGSLNLMEECEEPNLGLMGNKKRYALMDTLLMEHFRNPGSFGVKDIEDEVNTFMFGGHDTTACGLTFALLLIGGDQRVQDKLYEELESIFGDDMSRSISTEDCRQMKYLEMCIKESLRLYPPVPVIGRNIEQDFQTQGYTVPTGCQAMIYIYSLHRDCTFFPQPERFIPERFEPDAPIHRHPYAYLPFSAGPRNCIGQKYAMLEMKIVIGSVLRKFRLKSITHRDQVDVEMSVVMKAKSPVIIEFQKRF